ncbi:hypothetical protein [Amycolatopsis sp. 195334CR]|uniref:hypothetical protein n=1 Tax=Amycolatopsis sp. 195334CR TaxID=2814588 RepID=UPI001A90004C|nr:hypothetical protein [Amycolatopsis sp. 195334CR]MBN6034042.1 hypothetical protein [Amycolatopsis sp. 195334CR]
MTEASPRMCTKCGEKPTVDQKIGILCSGCIAALTAAGPLGGHDQHDEAAATSG